MRDRTKTFRDEVRPRNLETPSFGDLDAFALAVTRLKRYFLGMRIRAHTRFRVDSVFYFFGYSEFIPGRKQPIISPRATLQVNPGDVIEKISMSDGFWIKDIEGEIPDHPLLIDEGSGYILDTGPELMKYNCPIKIGDLMTIEELNDY